MTDNSDKDLINMQNLVRVVCASVITETMNNYQQEIGKRFDRLEKQMEDRERRFEDREKRIIDEILLKMQPIIENAKDKTVDEATSKSVAMIERAFNFNPNDNQQVALTQEMWAFTRDQLQNSKNSRNNIKQALFTKAVTIMWMFFIFLLGSSFGSVHKFLLEFGSMFPGVEK